MINPFVLYAMLAIGAVGVGLSLPRPRFNPQLIGAVIAAAGFGGVFIALARRHAPEPVFFYIFSFIALLSALRVITHPRPVYSALYFIFTILSSSVLYLLMRAEFMAFALLIIYAGAILITYLFVIMLAVQAPSEDQPESVSEYDAYSREPLLATVLGFVLLGVLTGMFARGMATLRPRDTDVDPQSRLAEMPRKILTALESRGVFEVFDRPSVTAAPGMMDFQKRRVMLTLDLAKAPLLQSRLEDAGFTELLGGRAKVDAMAVELSGGSRPDAGGFSKPADEPDGAPPARAREERRETLVPVGFPPDVSVDNIELVGFALVARHPMALELAGVILTMAMLGAVVLARKQVDLGEAEKAAAAARHTSTLPGPRGYGDAA